MMLRKPNPIRVMIVDDHDMVRRGLATILRVKADLELVGEASNGQEALHVCKRVQPDVILMDLVMPKMDGAAATRAIREHCSQIQVIALTSFTEKDLVQGALEAGAIGYLLKNVSAEELADAIRAAHAGRPTVAPEAAQVLAQAERMESLARAIIDAPPDASTLPELLREHIPGMFTDSHIEIRVFPEQTLLRHPGDWQPVPGMIWEWLRTAPEANFFLPGAAVPWGDDQLASSGLILMPILSSDAPQPMGGIFLSQRQDPGAVANLLPVVRSLAAQIASVLRSAEVHAQTVAQQKVARELALAGQIQASFLPGDLPDLPGWQLAAKLDPARETSGDFYDFVSLPEGRWGIVVADVADKGMGAALYMALSRTLVRTYAAEYPHRPDLVLKAASSRMLTDTRAGLFVTVFYGILEPESGLFTYCNAGHNPPYLLRAHKEDQVRALHKTGMALGVVEDTTWDRATIQLDPGDALVCYTDGITEAHNQQSTLFGRERLLQTLLAHRGTSAEDMKKALSAEVHAFMNDVPQPDDMTLVILIREPH
jgi:serine phosphatase RsbU (regulator of sigma subunit)/DNA-binding NarL/FixJ family response regulator